MLVQQQQFLFYYLEVAFYLRDAAVTYKKELNRLNAPYLKIIMTSDPTKDKQKEWDKYELAEKEKETFEKLFNLSIEEEPLSILIVVDMLLTGFDSHILQAMYIENKMLGTNNKFICQI